MEDGTVREKVGDCHDNESEERKRVDVPSTVLTGMLKKYVVTH